MIRRAFISAGLMIVAGSAPIAAEVRLAVVPTEDSMRALSDPISAELSQERGIVCWNARTWKKWAAS